MRVASTNLVGLQAEVKRAVHEVDKDLFVPQLEPMTTFLATHLAQPRFNMLLLAVFAGVAMILAAIGIYGVIAYSVTQRTREIGIRMALGAQKTQMLGMVLRQSLTLVVIGIVLGFLVALAATRVMATLLYGVGANDLSTYAIVIFLLGGAALLASYIPARRAMKVDPMVALRYDMGAHASRVLRWRPRIATSLSAIISSLGGETPHSTRTRALPAPNPPA